MPSAEHDHETPDRERIDKWLWAARFYKTRSLAAEAVAGGKVSLNGDRPKRAKLVGAGDTLSIRIGPYTHVVLVRGVSERRGPASAAALLYAETVASVAARESLSAQLKAATSAFGPDAGRPTKRDRREIVRWKDRG